MILNFTASPHFLLYVNETSTLICDALGGPRLILMMQSEDDTVIAIGAMGDDRLVYNFTAGNNFGVYTCNASIDDRQTTESELVGGTYMQALMLLLCTYVPAQIGLLLIRLISLSMVVHT